MASVKLCSLWENEQDGLQGNRQSQKQFQNISIGLNICMQWTKDSLRATIVYEIQHISLLFKMKNTNFKGEKHSSEYVNLVSAFLWFNSSVSVLARNELGIGCEFRSFLRRGHSRHSLHMRHEESSSDSIITTVLLKISPPLSSYPHPYGMEFSSISNNRECLLYSSHVYVTSGHISIYSVSHAAY